jgi:hypothetical protein
MIVSKITGEWNEAEDVDWDTGEVVDEGTESFHC